LNFAFGLGGPVTYHNGAERRAVAAGLLLQKILLETDAPFLTPHPHRGKRNEPAYIPLIAAEIARLHQCTPEEVGEITTQNAVRLFNLNAGIPSKP
jgi:TatD DNase family protein